MLIRIVMIMVLTCLTAGCMQVREAVKRPLGDDGELFLYCEPFPQDAGRLQFTIEEVSAVRDDGLAVTLTPEFKNFDLAGLSRQRLFAKGFAPPGRYSSIAIKVKNAILSSEEGKGRLLVPEQPYENQAMFTIRNGKATVVTMELKYRDAIGDVIIFRPIFTSTVPPVPLPELTGYMTNHADNTITVFDKRSARIGAMIETGKGPAGIALDQLRMLVYVAMTGEDTVGIIDVRENSFIDRIRLTPGDAPRFLAITPDGKLAVTANSRSNTASIIDLQSRLEVARLPAGIGAEYVLMDRSGRRAYVFNRLSNSITVIDLTTRVVAGTLQTESGPLYGQFSRKGDRLFVYHEMSPNILVVALDGQTMTRRINAGIGIKALKINTVTDQIYAGTRLGGAIDVYDPFTLIAVDFLNADGGVGYMTIDGDENNLLVIHPRNKLLRFINLIAKKERGLLDTGAEPYDVVIFGER
ncbi:MAG: beta-propeller fold lactonase family protein [Geobacteraceae bacterium]|nr:beta-propeller fold lactonase family protein [Geobacteraceae bacterium]NTW79821.1 beta-propeller fold lactonase family protein [Geobacteraceae bacterium]